VSTFSVLLFTFYVPLSSEIEDSTESNFAEMGVLNFFGTGMDSRTSEGD